MCLINAFLFISQQTVATKKTFSKLNSACCFLLKFMVISTDTRIWNVLCLNIRANFKRFLKVGLVCDKRTNYTVGQDS